MEQSLGSSLPIVIFHAAERLDESKVNEWKAVQLGCQLSSLGFQPIVTMLSPSFPGAVVVPHAGIRVLGFGYYPEKLSSDSDPLASPLVGPVYELFLRRLAFRHEIQLVHSFTLTGLRALLRIACHYGLPAVVSLPHPPESYDQSLFWKGLFYHLRERPRHASSRPMWGITAANLQTLEIPARLDSQYRVAAGKDFVVTTHPQTPEAWAKLYRTLLGGEGRFPNVKTIGENG
ncbi:MAG: hypothetical protein V2A74_14550 [bacterium]